jgi:hypothetical protein
MTDPEDNEEAEARPFLLSDGDCMVFDADYLDPEQQVEGVIAVQWGADRGLWYLMGSIEGATYRQEWMQVAPERGKARMRPVN